MRLKKLTEPQQWWKEALESGYFEQYHGRLGYLDKRCCLGVQCDIYATVRSDGWWEHNTFGLLINWEENNNAEGFPPDAVRKYFNLSLEQMYYFQYLNDELLFTFKQIAKAIQWVVSTKDVELIKDLDLESQEHSSWKILHKDWFAE